MTTVSYSSLAHQVATQNEILRGVVGSSCYGTSLDGSADRDEMGIFIEPPSNVCGLRAIDHYLYRDKPEGERSASGDLDLVLYSLRKFCHLAVQGNPSILMMLWLPEYLTLTETGKQLLMLRSAFRSRDAGARFLGYLVSQKMRLTGERARNVSRPDLVEKHGYDTKFAMHALRLGLQGIEYLSHGTITLPIPISERELLLEVRRGEVNYTEAVALIEDAEQKLRAILADYAGICDTVRVDQFLVSAHLRHWNWPATSIHGEGGRDE